MLRNADLQWEQRERLTGWSTCFACKRPGFNLQHHMTPKTLPDLEQQTRSSAWALPDVQKPKTVSPPPPTKTYLPHFSLSLSFFLNGRRPIPSCACLSCKDWAVLGSSNMVLGPEELRVVMLKGGYLMWGILHAKHALQPFELSLMLATLIPPSPFSFFALLWIEIRPLYKCLADKLQPQPLVLLMWVHTWWSANPDSCRKNMFSPLGLRLSPTHYFL